MILKFEELLLLDLKTATICRIDGDQRYIIIGKEALYA